MSPSYFLLGWGGWGTGSVSKVNNGDFLFIGLTTMGTFIWILIGWFIKVHPLIGICRRGNVHKFIGYCLIPLDPCVFAMVNPFSVVFMSPSCFCYPPSYDLVFTIQNLVFAIHHLDLLSTILFFAICHLVFAIRHFVFAIWHLVFAIWHLVFLSTILFLLSTILFLLSTILFLYPPSCFC